MKKQEPPLLNCAIHHGGSSFSPYLACQSDKLSFTRTPMMLKDQDLLRKKEVLLSVSLRQRPVIIIS